MEPRIEPFVAEASVPAVFTAVPGFPGASVEPVASGTSCLVASIGGRPLARGSITTHDDLHGAPGRTGMIGHYEALERDAGVALLEAAAGRLAELGARRVLGPMNGGTWARYRLALPSEPGDPVWEPPVFAGEPTNRPEYPSHFTAAGFTVVARYESRIDDLADDHGSEASEIARVADSVAAAGLSLRPLDQSRFEQELDTLHAISLGAFGENLYYAPLGAAEFRAMYLPFRTRVDPEFVLIALDRHERPCGYLFAFPDPLAVRDGTPRRLVVKTIAVLPGVRGHGLGNHMLDRMRWSARRRGYREIVHALMHVSNVSTRMSARHGGRMFRRYALWQKDGVNT